MDHAEQARELLARMRPGDDGPLTLASAASAHALLDVAAAIREQTAAINSSSRAARKAEPAW